MSEHASIGIFFIVIITQLSIITAILGLYLSPMSKRLKQLEHWLTCIGEDIGGCNGRKVYVYDTKEKKGE